jgi:hypothetical protein
MFDGSIGGDNNLFASNYEYNAVYYISMIDNEVEENITVDGSPSTVAFVAFAANTAPRSGLMTRLQAEHLYLLYKLPCLNFQ